MIATTRTLLEAPRITGIQALPWAALAVAVPTLIRDALDSAVIGVTMMPYIPFFLLTALFLTWGYAAVTAIASAAVADALFIGPPNQLLEGPSDLAAVGFFLVSAAMIVGLVQATRKAHASRTAAVQSSGAPGGVVFSLEDGQAWASWYGSGPAIRLGPQEEVTEMMQDFIAQVELGKRLAARN
jgi:hypothetical protein